MLSPVLMISPVIIAHGRVVSDLDRRVHHEMMRSDRLTMPMRAIEFIVKDVLINSIV